MASELGGDAYVLVSKEPLEHVFCTYQTTVFDREEYELILSLHRGIIKVEAINESNADAETIAKTVKKMKKTQDFAEKKILDLRTPMGDRFEELMHSGGTKPYDTSHFMTDEEVSRVLAEQAAVAQKKTKK